MPLRPERLQILLRQPEQSHRRAEAFPVLGMGWMLELLLEMDKRPRRLDQALEILRILRRDRIVEPHLFENIVRFIITLLIPALEKRAVIGVIRQTPAPGAIPSSSQGFDELRNPLAFAHEGLNLTAPAMMGKRRRFSLREERSLRLRRRSRP